MTYYAYYGKQTRRKKKYNNKTKQYVDRYYDSIKEANYAEDLDWRIKLGEIKEWIPQFKIELRVNDRKLCNYFVDFKVIDKDGAISFHEVKGFATPLWQLKWKILEATIEETGERLCDGQIPELIVIK